MAAVGSSPVNFYTAYPINYANASTGTDSIVFYYNPANNGTFKIPLWPAANVENGWFDMRANAGNDHHLLTIDITNGNLYEMYQYYPLTDNASCLTCNSQEGVQYTYADYGLPTNGASNAGGTFIAPLTLHSQEFVNAVATSGAIMHALQMTLSNGFICDSGTASACCVGSNCNAGGSRHVWPAQTDTNSGGGIVPYGACFRLKSAYDISGFSAAAQIILTEMKNYCTFLTDGGGNWTITTDWDNMPLTEVTALLAINSANIATSNWGAVDLSSLEESATSGGVNTGERVCFNSSTGTTCTHVDLQGTAVNVATNQLYVMPGTPQFQLTAYSNGAYTCSMSPTVGSLTSGCLYTAPSSESSVTTTTVTFTSSVDSSVTAQMLIYVTPSVMRFTQDTANYTDSGSNVWYGGYGLPSSVSPAEKGCCQENASFPAITDKQLWWNHYASSGTINDFKIDYHVPNGVYKVTYNLGTTVAAGNDKLYFYAQGALVATVDPSVAAGGANEPYTLTQNVTVANGVLSFYNAGIGNQTNNAGDISSISVQQLSLGVPSAPPKAGLLVQ
jgi:hypothetical protein